MYLRIKYLRKTLKLSQNDFGAKLEVSRDVINNIEQNRNKNPISEHLISRICRTFSTNETWLRTGEGDMFVKRQKSPVLDDLKEEYKLSENELSFIQGYLDLSESDRQVLFNAIHNLVKGVDETKTTTPTYNKPITNNKPITKKVKTISKTVDIPVFTHVAAGLGAYAGNEITEYQSVPAEWIDNSEEYSIITVKGDSMSPKFEDGDQLLVKKQDSVDSGTIAVVLIDGENSVVKKVTYGDNWIELISINSQYPPRRFEGENVLRLRIFGVVERCIEKSEQ